MKQTQSDVAIIGGGPAGLQVALMLARTRRRVMVFDAPEPPRNAASHGVHNFVGLDGLTPAEIREQAWKQIAVYNTAELRSQRVVDVQSNAEYDFLVTDETGLSIAVKHVVLALGFRDVYPDIPGFAACWGTTIIACPYCDGYENRDRAWGLVASSSQALEHMPQIYRNWTSQAKLIVPPELPLDDEQHAALTAQGMAIHRGKIVEVQHTANRVEAVTLDTGEQVAVDTLWWRPDETPQPLTTKIITHFNLELDKNGYIKTDGQHQTAVHGLWAVGDVRGWAGALGAAYQASQAAVAISRSWYIEPVLHERA
ncbi:MAG: NAD(P)/FAD-dependent oxidoreductase [Anaerolineae bacterium]